MTYHEKPTCRKSTEITIAYMIIAEMLADAAKEEHTTQSVLVMAKMLRGLSDALVEDISK